MPRPGSYAKQNRLVPSTRCQGNTVISWAYFVSIRILGKQALVVAATQTKVAYVWCHGYWLVGLFPAGISPGRAGAEQGSPKFCWRHSHYPSNSGNSHHHTYSAGHPFSILIPPTQGTKVPWWKTLTMSMVSLGWAPMCMRVPLLNL